MISSAQKGLLLNSSFAKRGRFFLEFNTSFRGINLFQPEMMNFESGNFSRVMWNGY